MEKKLNRSFIIAQGSSEKNTLKKAKTLIVSLGIATQLTFGSRGNTNEGHSRPDAWVA